MTIAWRHRAATGRVIATLLLLSGPLLSGCDRPTGPVLGDWHGIESTLAVSYDARIEIILDGPPGATAGTYHYVRLLQIDDGIGPGPRYTSWTDRWTSRPVDVGGTTVPLIHLAHLPDAAIPDYLHLPNDLLLPVPNPARPDLSPHAFRYALQPEPRGTYGFGRP